MTFLLRLKPAPTPPIRRKRSEHVRTSTITTTPKGWDVVIEKRGSSSPTVPKRASPLSSPLRSRRFSLDFKRANDLPPRQFDAVKEPQPPVLPLKYLPSAPPQDLVEHLSWYPKPYYPMPFCNAHTSTTFSSSYPNLGYSNDGRNSGMFEERQGNFMLQGKMGGGNNGVLVTEHFQGF